MPAARVNRAALCRLLRKSETWLDRRLVEDAAFPVVERGGRGVQWQFDPEAVVAYLAEQQAEDERRTAEAWAGASGIHDERQRHLPTLLTPQARLAEVRAQLAEQDLAERTGRMVDAEEMQQVLGSAFAALGSAIDSTLDQLARRHGWSEAVRFDAGEAFDAARRAFVAAVTQAPEANTRGNPEEPDDARTAA